MVVGFASGVSKKLPALVGLLDQQIFNKIILIIVGEECQRW
jgi:hypothetical protein